MSSDSSRHVPDVRYRPAGVGHGDTRQRAMCGHLSRTGKRINGVLVRCVECETKRREQT